MIPWNRRLDFEIRNNPLEHSKISEKKNFQLRAWYHDENVVRENLSDHIQPTFQDSEDLTWPLAKDEVPQPFNKYSKDEMWKHKDERI